MKAFSDLVPTGEDRKFEVGGEVYEWVTPYWEDLAALYDEDVELTQRALRAAISESEEEQERGPTTKENIERTQQRIKLFLAKDDHARWDKLCKRKDDPVPLHMWGQVFSWLMETATGRPTEPPSDSASGGGNGAQSSQAESRSRAAGRRR